jgi:tetratricopeptide (TPR) repeat protein
MPAYFNNVIYYGPVGDHLKAFSISNAKLSTSPIGQSGNSFVYPGATPSVSANGTSNGIVWVVENRDPAVLHAYNAATLAQELYNSNLMYVGRFEEGIAEAKRARDLDPLSLPVNNALAGRLLVAGRVDEALKQLQETLEMDPHFAPGHQTLGWAYLNKGKHEEAIQEFQEALQLSGTDDTDLMLDLGFAYAAVGNREEARRILAKLKNLHDRGLVPSGSIGILYGALGELNEAFAWLEKAYEERDPELTYLKVPGRRFEPLRHDPRFQDLVRRVGLPD